MGPLPLFFANLPFLVGLMLSTYLEMLHSERLLLISRLIMLSLLIICSCNPAHYIVGVGLLIIECIDEVTKTYESKAAPVMSRAELALKFRTDTEGEAITVGYVRDLTVDISEAFTDLMTRLHLVRVNRPTPSHLY